MPQFEIYFHGLICFYAPESRLGRRDYKTEALFVDDPEHKRRIVTADGRFGDDFTSITTSLPSGITDGSDTAFQETVPHLGDRAITRSSIVVDPTKAIRLGLPDGGKLHVAQLYPFRGAYVLDDNITVQPVCRLSILTIKADALTITVDGTDVSVPAAKSWVAILNFSKKPGDAGVAKNHFHRYAYLTGGRLNDVAEVSDDKEKVEDLPYGHYVDTVLALDELRSEVHVLNSAQCSNTNWP